jgi:CRISPR-associated protein (TIGR03985 family)
MTHSFDKPTFSLDALSNLSGITPQKLSEALRRLIIVLSIYNLKDIWLEKEFSVSEWMQNYLHGIECQNQGCSSETCRYQKTAKQLLSEIYGINLEQLASTIGGNFYVSLADIDSELSKLVLHVSDKTFKTDFEYLTSGKNVWLTRKRTPEKSSWIYSKVLLLPNDDRKAQVSNISDTTYLNSEEKYTLLEILKVVEEYHPTISGIIDKICPGIFINSAQRLLFRVDNVIPKHKSDDIEDIHRKLAESWDKLVSYKYESSYYKKIVDCKVYPVCTSFYKKVQYLYAWGLNPSGKVDWYTYRLDRINLESWKNLDGDELNTDRQLHSQYLNKLPSSQDVSDALRLAWGTDITQPIETLLLRFDRKYYNLYIDNTDRGFTAKALKGGAKEAVKFLQETYIDNPINPDDLTRQNVARSIERINLYPQDAYYKIDFRPKDKYTIAQLKSWGDNVEVLAPFDLRKQIIEETERAITNYGLKLVIADKK